MRGPKIILAITFLILLSQNGYGLTLGSSISQFRAQGPSLPAGILDPDEERATSDVIAFYLDFDPSDSVDWQTMRITSMPINLGIRSSVTNNNYIYGDMFGIITEIDTRQISPASGHTTITDQIEDSQTVMLEFAKDASPGAQWQRVDLTLVKPENRPDITYYPYGLKYDDLAYSINGQGDVISFDLADYYDADLLLEYLKSTNGILAFCSLDDSEMTGVEVSVQLEAIPEPTAVILFGLGGLILNRRNKLISK
jgi:hypothetical protein